MTIGERIKARRLEIGLSVDQLAEAIGKNRATVYRYESNDIEKYTIDVLYPLAEALHTSPAYLMGWDDPGDVSANQVMMPFRGRKKAPDHMIEALYGKNVFPAKEINRSGDAAEADVRLIPSGVSLSAFEKASNQPDRGAGNVNIIRMAGRDGTFVERTLTDDQMAAIKAILNAMPDASEDL